MHNFLRGLSLAPLFLLATIAGACRGSAPAAPEPEVLAESLRARAHDHDPGAGKLPSFWVASAVEYSPRVRDARSRAEAARLRSKSAGRPEALGLELGALDSDPFGFEAGGSLDLVGLLGAEPAAADRRAARAGAAADLAEYEHVRWTVSHDAARALSALVAARSRVERAATLAAEVERDMVVVEGLGARGRVPANQLGVARARAASVQLTLARARDAEAEARSGLAHATGHPAFGELDTLDTEGISSSSFAMPSDPSGRPIAGVELLRHNPELIWLGFQERAAAARLELAASRRWPGLRLGPRLVLEPESVGGGFVALSIPWPGAVTGLIEAARVEHERARERLADALRDSLDRLETSARTQANLSSRLDGAALELEREVAGSWSGLRARLAAQRSTAFQWSEGVDRRVETLFVVVNEWERGWLVSLERSELLGPLLGGDPIAAQAAIPAADPPPGRPPGGGRAGRPVVALPATRIFGLTPFEPTPTPGEVVR